MAGRASCSIVALCLLLGAPTFADENSPAKTRELDLSVPDSPAFAILGVSPEKVVRPSSAKALVTGLLSGVDENGTVKTGLALDFNPVLAVDGARQTIASYRDHYERRLAARLQVSFATVRGSEEDKSVKMAIGIRATIFDSGDPRMDRILDTCFEEAVPSQGNMAVPPAKLADWEKAETETFQAKAKGCVEKSQKRNWNRSSWIVGFTPTLTSTTGAWDDFQASGSAFWTSFAWGFDNLAGFGDADVRAKEPQGFLAKYGQLVLHARLRNGEDVAHPTLPKTMVSQDTTLLAARLRLGSETMVATLEASYERAKREGLPTNSNTRFSAGFERKLAEGVWLTASMGGEGGETEGKRKAFVLSTLKWAPASSGTSFAPPK